VEKRNINPLSGIIVICCFMLLLSCFVSGDAFAKLALGPYVQSSWPDSAIIRWQTSEPCPSVLLYGESKPGEYRVTEPVLKTEHQITLTSLNPNTTYLYQIEVVKNGEELATEVYEYDTSFNYSLPFVPRRDARSTPYSETARHIVKESGISQGYCVVLGAGEGQLAYELARQTKLRIVGVDDDAKRVDKARKYLKDAGVYGSRVTIQYVPSLSELPFPSRFANLVVSERMISQGKCVGTAAEAFRILCPGGATYLGRPAKARKKVSQKKLENWLKEAALNFGIEDNDSGLWAKIMRDPTPGSGWWSHEYGDADNSANGRETLQGATGTQDLEVQWIGLPGPRANADRNGRKPSPLAINGRLFIQGLHRIAALDAYNGAILWSLEIPDLERFNMPRDCSNWCADDDYVYAAIKGKCWRLDAANGHVSKVYDLVTDPRKDWEYDWGYIARSGDKIFGSAVKQGTAFTEFWGGSGQGWYDATSGEATDKVCSDSFFALMKDSGETAWTYSNGLIINSTITISDGRVYFVECRNQKAKASQARRMGMSEFWDDQYLVSLNADNGEKLWEKPIDTADGIVMFHLSYGSDSLYLVSSGDNKYNLYAYDAAAGTAKWNTTEAWASNNHGGHMARPAVVGNTVFMRPYTFDASSGEKLEVKMPGGGCGTYAATSGAIIFRAGNVTMWDMSTQAVTSWHRLRPDCWLSTIPACGLVLSPEAGGGCSCGSWMETSIAFAPIDSKEAKNEQ